MNVYFEYTYVFNNTLLKICNFAYIVIESTLLNICFNTQ